MAELKTYVCPNCGASTTNSQNCEYCGSLLVRFAEKGIDISNTTYKSDAKILPGLVVNFKQNLKIQEEYNGELVATQILWTDEDSKWKEGGSWDGVIISSPNHSTFFDNTVINTEDAVALIFKLTLFTLENESEFPHNSQNEKYKKMIEEFKQLASFPLFSSHISEYVDDTGGKWKVWDYYINFGKDAEGAARLISEILVKLYGIQGFSIYTGEGDEEILAAKEGFKSENGFNGECEPEASGIIENSSTIPLSDWQKILLGFSGVFGLICLIISWNQRMDLSVILVSIGVLVLSVSAFISPLSMLLKNIFGDDPRNKPLTIAVFVISLILLAFVLL